MFGVDSRQLYIRENKRDMAVKAVAALHGADSYLEGSVSSLYKIFGGKSHSFIYAYIVPQYIYIIEY